MTWNILVKNQNGNIIKTNILNQGGTTSAIQERVKHYLDKEYTSLEEFEKWLKIELECRFYYNKLNLKQLTMNIKPLALLYIYEHNKKCKNKVII